MPRLARLRFVSIGHPNARFEDLVLDFRDAGGRATDSTIWLRNGGGKSSLLNLFFALLRPDRRDFLGGRAEARKRRLEDYVAKGDHAAVIAEWELDARSALFDEPAPRYLTGAVYEWRPGASSEEPHLRRLWFSGRAADGVPELSLEGLPLVAPGADGRPRRRGMQAFRQEWLALRQRHPAAEAAVFESQHEWAAALTAAGLDPELFAYQVRMNQREGAVDELFRFDEHEQFVDFLLELALDPSFGGQVARNIEAFRQELRSRHEQLMPQRELLAGLRQRLAPLAALAQRRAAVLRDAHRSALAIDHLERHVAGRCEAVRREEEQARASAEAERTAADLARAATSAARRRAAALRLSAAERKHVHATQDLARAQDARAQADREARAWEAAVPLYLARRHEQRAAGFRHALAERTRETAPLRKALEDTAAALAGALSWEAGRLREEAANLLASEQAHRDEARQARSYAAEARAAASAAEVRAHQLETELHRARAERERLAGAGALMDGEEPAAAAERLAAEVQAVAARLAALDARQAELSAHATGIRDALERAAADLANAQAGVAQEERRLHEGLDASRRIEEDPVLRRCLESETIDAERLPDHAIRQLREAARGAFERVLGLRIARAEDDRALLALEQSGLLPPSAEVGQVLAALEQRIPAWSGWEYIATNVPPASRRDVVGRCVELATGVVVREGDFEAVGRTLAEAGLAPVTPVVVRTPSALDDGPGTAARLVLGPASDAWFDRGAGAAELERRRHRVDEIAARLAAEESARTEADDAATRLAEFRRQWPRGWLARQRVLVESAREVCALAQTRQATLRRELAGVVEETALLARERAARASDLESCRGAHRLVSAYLERCFVHEDHWRAELARQLAERTARVAEEASWLREAEAGDGRAGACSAASRRCGEEARAVESERDAVRYVESAPDPRRGPIDELRDRYRQQRVVYERELGADALLELQRDAEAAARGERGRLAQVLGTTLDEASVAALLADVTSEAEVHARRQHAADQKNSAFGAHGNKSQALQAAQRELDQARAAADEMGGVPRLPEGEVPESAALAEAEARRLDAAARTSEEDAARHDDAAKDAERRCAAAAAAGERLRMEQEQLDAVREGSAEVIAMARAAAAASAVAAAATAAGAPGEDEGDGAGAGEEERAGDGEGAGAGEGTRTGTGTRTGAGAGAGAGAGVGAGAGAGEGEGGGAGAVTRGRAGWIAPADDALASARRELAGKLRAAREQLADVDRERQRRCAALRDWADEPRFAGVDDVVSRRLTRVPEADIELHAAGWSEQLEVRLSVIAGKLEEIDRHRGVLVDEAVSAAEEGLALLRRAGAYSRIPDHVPGFGGATFLRVATSEPEDPGERRGRIGQLIDELAEQGEIPGGLALVQLGVRRLARPIRVRVLNPDPDLGQQSVDITAMARFSGGEQLTMAILLFCTLARLRARARGAGKQVSTVLVLDNPVGRASRVRFLDLQRDVARTMGVQLVYTTAVNDHDALRALPNVIRIRNERADRVTGRRIVEREAAPPAAVDGAPAAVDAAPALEAARVFRPERQGPPEPAAGPGGS